MIETRKRQLAAVSFFSSENNRRKKKTMRTKEGDERRGEEQIWLNHYAGNRLWRSARLEQKGRRREEKKRASESMQSNKIQIFPPPKTCIFSLYLLLLFIFIYFIFAFSFFFRSKILDNLDRLWFPRWVQGPPSPRCMGFHYLMILYQIVTREPYPFNSLWTPQNEPSYPSKGYILAYQKICSSDTLK